MSVEGFQFDPASDPRFPKLVMRAFQEAEEFAEWILTPPEGAGWFVYKFEAKQENGVLHLTIEPDFMTPKGPE